MGPWWSLSLEGLLDALGSTRDGLSASEARERLERYGPNRLDQRRSLTRLSVLWNQVRSPLLLLLLFAALASALAGEWTDAAVVFAIVTATVGVGYRREYRAQRAVEALRSRIRSHATVLRDGTRTQVPVEEVVPGDVVLLAAGSLVPGDGAVLEATDCYLSEAALTGESFPVEKEPGPSAADAPLARRKGAVFMGTNVRSGTARCLVAATGPNAAFGAIAERLSLRRPETGFDRGLRHFGYLLTSAMLVMALGVFAVHVLGGRPPVETLLFAIALAVGLSPELMPAILSVSLSRGAEALARHGVVVRRLNAIEDLGSMDVLCTDKTGTLTEGVVRLDAACDAGGAPSDAVLELAALNAALETGLPSPLDDAILAARTPDLAAWTKLAEVPFDFVRKRVSVVVQGAGGARLITKGAVGPVLDACTRLEGGAPLDAAARAGLEARCAELNGRGLRALAVATRALDVRDTYHRDDERELTFQGRVTFLDRPKEDVRAVLAALAKQGVAVKVITGDSAGVAQYVASLVGLDPGRTLTGAGLDRMSDEALWRAAETTQLFVEVDPHQKERIILALKKSGHVVGFLGDGVNDAPAMHAADAGISVDQAVDVAREAADFVLLQRDLDVIRRGVEEGRRTFANTLKYVLTSMSANLGNMLSMSVASLFLPFLPLTAGQILLNNFLSDVPALGIADDRVDPELVRAPQRWQLRFIGRFMLEFGLLSSAFDFATFGVLLYGFRAAPAEFRSGWFVESLLTELAVALVVRTRRPAFRSRPGRLLAWTSALLAVLAVAIPYLPWSHFVGLVPLPPSLLAAVVGITVAYVVSAELLKQWFYRRLQRSGGSGR
ncbi:MAG: magnesium-translocating P-type ATPase [Archangiaceae bacterium]|nr:magnesium-translocating P-type ATPase [Archangiaceae bacterium]